MGLEPADLKETIYSALVPEEDEVDKPLPIHKDLYQLGLTMRQLIKAPCRVGDQGCQDGQSGEN
jgi:hypothetical protein